jgi:hypothetical protein
MTFAFGKYYGKEVSDPEVPEDYLQWLIDANKKSIAAYQAELDRRTAAVDASLGMTEKIIQAGYRELAKKYHPDAGGDPTVFRELQGSYEQLKGVLSEVKGTIK